MQQKTICITGATSGIGEACAIAFAKEGHRLIITGRRKERLETLAQTLRTQYNVAITTLVFDVQDKEACFNETEILGKTNAYIDVLINNAGLALGRDAFDEADMQDWDTMLNTNVKGLLYMSRACLPLLKNAAAPYIINIGSIAAKEVYEHGNVYCASKSAVEAISKGMRIDLRKYGIRVSCVHPGAVETEFSVVRFKGDQQKADATYDNFEPLTGTDIALVIQNIVNLPANICINDMVITPKAQASATYFNKAPVIK
jgi:3-hydroxy acid dehydrogenase / malonic semialdehyde reductase